MASHQNISEVTSPRNSDSYMPFPWGTGEMAGTISTYLDNSLIEPISALEWKSTPEWHLGPRVLQHSMWMYVIDGNGIGWIDNPSRQFNVGKDDFIFIPKGAWHDIYPQRNVYFKYINVHFHIQLYSSCDLLNFLNVSGTIKENRSEFFKKSSNALAREYALREPGWRRMMHTYILQVIAHVFRYHCEMINFHPDKKINKSMLRLLPVLGIVNNEIGNRALDISRLCEIIGVSEVYLRKLFRHSLGVGPNAYIQQRRIEKATRLLRESNLSLIAIAEKCGFLNQYYFHRIFKKLIGTTPLTYRKTTNGQPMP